jgi:PBSX family phage terminase large subunit
MSTGLLHRYEPRGSARELFRIRAPEVLVSGPAGTGKSRACLEKLHTMCLLNPGMRGLIVRKTATSLTSSALKTFREHVAAEPLLTGAVEWYGGSAQEPAQYKYHNGSSIVVGGMDRATRIMSTEYDVIYVQEATELTITDWEHLLTRLRNNKVSFQQLLADCNPDAPTHWLKQRCDDGKTILLYSTHEENPVLFDVSGRPTPNGESYLGKLDQLTGVRHARLRKGLWVAAEGIVYEEFDPAVHLVDRFEVPNDWQRWWSIDFGYTNPFVWQNWAEDPDGVLYLVQEVYRTGRLVEDHARTILNIVAPGGKWNQPEPTAIVCDHDAEGRATLERVLELSTVAANKKVTDGIQAVASRLRVGPKGSRLRIMRDAVVCCGKRDVQLVEAGKPTCTAEEFAGYVWADGKEQPVKADDHGLDALRYLVMEVDHGGRPGVRWL